MTNLTSENLNLLKTKDKVILVDYFADWCSSCKILTPRLEELEKEYPNIIFIKVNVENNMEHAKELGIRSLPTVMVLKNGEPIHRSSGANTPEYYKEILNNA